MTFLGALIFVVLFSAIVLITQFRRWEEGERKKGGDPWKSFGEQSD